LEKKEVRLTLILILIFPASIHQGIQILKEIPKSFPELIVPSEIEDVQSVISLPIMSASYRSYWRNFIEKQFEDDYGKIFFEDFFLANHNEQRQESSAEDSVFEESDRVVRCSFHPATFDLTVGAHIAVFGAPGKFW
jgi:hypothetical protein